MLNVISTAVRSCIARGNNHVLLIRDIDLLLAQNAGDKGRGGPPLDGGAKRAYYLREYFRDNLSWLRHEGVRIA